MRQLLHRAGYFLRKGLDNLRQHLFINAVAIGTITVSFFLIGSALMIYENMKGILGKWGEKIQVTAYFKDGVKQGAVEHTLHAIREISGVEDVLYISKDEALRSFRKEMKGMAGFFDGVKINPLPAYCEVVLNSDSRSAQRVKEIASTIQEMDAVNDVQFGQEWVERLQRSFRFCALAGSLSAPPSFLLCGSLCRIPLS